MCERSRTDNGDFDVIAQENLLTPKSTLAAGCLGAGENKPVLSISQWGPPTLSDAIKTPTLTFLDKVR